MTGIQLCVLARVYSWLWNIISWPICIATPSNSLVPNRINVLGKSHNIKLHHRLPLIMCLGCHLRHFTIGVEELHMYLMSPSRTHVLALIKYHHLVCKLLPNTFQISMWLLRYQLVVGVDRQLSFQSWVFTTCCQRGSGRKIQMGNTNGK